MARPLLPRLPATTGDYDTGVGGMNSATTAPISGKVTWFEIGSADPARARAFYGDLFGWAPTGDQAVYLAVQNPEGIPGGIIPVPAGVVPYATFCVEVDDVDAAAARAQALGADVVIAPETSPNGVRSAYLRDPDGSLFAVYRFGE
jgi:uncharacterized protein